MYYCANKRTDGCIAHGTWFQRFSSSYNQYPSKHLSKRQILYLCSLSCTMTASVGSPSNNLRAMIFTIFTHLSGISYLLPVNKICHTKMRHRWRTPSPIISWTRSSDGSSSSRANSIPMSSLNCCARNCDGNCFFISDPLKSDQHFERIESPKYFWVVRIVTVSGHETSTLPSGKKKEEMSTSRTNSTVKSAAKWLTVWQVGPWLFSSFRPLFSVPVFLNKVNY